MLVKSHLLVEKQCWLTVFWREKKEVSWSQIRNFVGKIQAVRGPATPRTLDVRVLRAALVAPAGALPRALKTMGPMDPLGPMDQVDFGRSWMDFHVIF